MKRILLSVLALTGLFTCVNGQARIALQGGLHSSSVIEENNQPNWELDKGYYKSRTGVHLGFLADLRLGSNSKFYLQPSVNFYNKGRKYAFSQDSTVVYKFNGRPDSVVNTFYNINRRQYVNYIDIPFNLVYKLPLGKSSKFIIGAGPYASFYYSGKEAAESLVAGISYENDENENLTVGKEPGNYRSFDYGVNGLAGFEFGRVYLTVNYSRGLKDFYEPETYTATDYKHEVMGGTFGIFLGRQVKPVPKDTDGDGVPDSKDKCPAIAGTIQFAGCPDTDNDGITDADDACPGIAGPADNKGCPYPDRDHDGVADRDDRCPDVAGLKEQAGCPSDRDKDGITDNDDKCPDIAGLARYQGCPVPDTDHDGVNDEEDLCKDAVGTAENRGCPAITQEIRTKVEYAAKKIQFRVNSAELTTGSYQVLDEVVRVLGESPDLKMAIEGHTSAEGKYETNMKLSSQRADAVKTYLISKGIAEQRLTATGVGPNKPLNPGKTPQEKALNRRVELQLSNH